MINIIFIYYNIQIRIYIIILYIVLFILYIIYPVLRKLFFSCLKLKAIFKNVKRYNVRTDLYYRRLRKPWVTENQKRNNVTM